MGRSLPRRSKHGTPDSASATASTSSPITHTKSPCAVGDHASLSGDTITKAYAVKTTTIPLSTSKKKAGPSGSSPPINEKSESATVTRNDAQLSSHKITSTSSSSVRSGVGHDSVCHDILPSEATTKIKPRAYPRQSNHYGPGSHGGYNNHYGPASNRSASYPNDNVHRQRSDRVWNRYGRNDREDSNWLSNNNYHGRTERTSDSYNEGLANHRSNDQIDGNNQYSSRVDANCRSNDRRDCYKKIVEVMM